MREFDPLIATARSAGVVLLVWLLLTLVCIAGEKRSGKFRHTLYPIRFGILPSLALLYYFLVVDGRDAHSAVARLVLSYFWLSLIWLFASILKVMLTKRFVSEVTSENSTPHLLIDLIRFSLALLGVVFVLIGVWEQDIGNLIATLGVGSLVLGLALQDTLGNLFAGIALFFERPFAVGNWIRIGDVIGKVVEANWRAVRLLTRDGDLIIFPNSVLGKERIENYSEPTHAHETSIKLSFSYEDPPSKVKECLERCAQATSKVILTTPPKVRTKAFLDSSILYEMEFVIHDFKNLEDIEEDFLTRVWYAAKREGLTFAYPTRTIYSTAVPYAPPTAHAQRVEAMFSRGSLFSILSAEERALLSAHARFLVFGKGETILSQGHPVRALSVIDKGKVIVTRTTQQGTEEDLASLSAGEFFGEISLLTGEHSTANVTASEDCELLAIDQEAFKILLAQRSELAEKLAQIVVARRQGISKVEEDSQKSSTKTPSTPSVQVSSLVKKIKEFFSL